MKSDRETLLAYILETIEKHHADTDFTVSKLAKEVSISESTLRRVIKTHLNQTVIQTIHQIRVNKAKKLLKAGYSVTTTAYECGYRSHAVFSKKFKTMTKQTPRSYLEFNLPK